MWRRRVARASESGVPPPYHPLSVRPEQVMMGTAVTGVSGEGPGCLWAEDLAVLWGQMEETWEGTAA